MLRRWADIRKVPHVQTLSSQRRFSRIVILQAGISAAEAAFHKLKKGES
jgi:hypothetical protein